MTRETAEHLWQSATPVPEGWLPLSGPATEKIWLDGGQWLEIFNHPDGLGRPVYVRRGAGAAETRVGPHPVRGT
jgi:hypothetical protein